MNEENLSLIHKFDSKIDTDGSFNIPKDELKQLYDKGFRDIQVVILGSSISAVRRSGINDDLFKNIKERQALPDSVVLDFLRIKGILADTNYKNKVKF